MKMQPKSPLMKALIGKQKNLNEGLKKAILESPGKMMPDAMAKSPAKIMGPQPAMKGGTKSFDQADEAARKQTASTPFEGMGMNLLKLETKLVKVQGDMQWLKTLLTKLQAVKKDIQYLRQKQMRLKLKLKQPL